MKRFISVSGARTRLSVPLVACLLSLAGCGGGNGDPGPVITSSGALATPPVRDGGAKTADASIGSTAPAAVAQLANYAVFKLGTLSEAGHATLDGGSLGLDGRRHTGVNLAPGNCSAGSEFSHCASVPGQSTFTLCGSDGGAGTGTDRIRSRYVLFDPQAQRITDPGVLKGLSFSGHENCGQDNVGAQPKGAPSATLAFDSGGNLTLTRFDTDPAKVSRAPALFINLNSETVSNGVTARFHLYRSNGRYFIVAAGVPTTGATAAEPGTLIAFVQN